MFSNRTEIILDSILGRRVLHDDPINYEEAETEIGRSEKTFGIFLTQTNNLEFYGKDKQYLENLWLLKGPQAKCKLIRKEQHPTTDEWQLKATGYLDFTTRKIKDGKLSIDFVEGGLREILTSQMREKFELGRTTDINGNSIPDLLTNNLVLKGRDIFLLSKYALEKPREFQFYSGGWQGGTRNAFYPVPMDNIANSDPDNLNNVFESLNEKGGHGEGSSETRFLNKASRDLGKVVLDLNFSFAVMAFNTQNGGYPSNRSLYVVLRRYSDQSSTGGAEYTFEEETVLYNINTDPIDPVNLGVVHNVQQSFTFEGDTAIKQGESLGFYITSQGHYDTFGDNTTEHLDLTIKAISTYLQWSEDSYYKPTTAKAMTLFEAGNRLTEIYTGKPCFESYLLEGKTDQILKDANHQLLISTGGWLRNLKIKQEDGSLKEWPIELSFEDFYKTNHALLPVGYGISLKGNRQNIILEDLKFFFQRTVKINLGKIIIKERSTAQEFCYQSLKFGYLKGGEYEKPLGLDEYNTQTTFRSPLTVTDNEYEALGPSRTDSYGAEDARRMQNTADEDSPYDKDNFLFDVKKSGGGYEVRSWQDDFESPPTGVYSPQTAYNLNLTPGRNRQRHEYWFTSGFYKLEDEAMQFLNSKGNSTLKTKKAGENELKENAPSIPVPELSKPLFDPEWIDAEAPFSQSVLDQITGTSMIDGREVNNYYCMAEFINENNRKERAFIFTVKVKDKFTFKLLKAHGSYIKT